MAKLIFLIAVHLVALSRPTNSQRPIPSNSSSLINFTPSSTLSNNNLYQTNNINIGNNINDNGNQQFPSSSLSSSSSSSSSSSTSQLSGKNRGGGSFTSKINILQQLSREPQPRPQQPPLTSSLQQQQQHHSLLSSLPVNQSYSNSDSSSIGGIVSGIDRYGYDSGYTQAPGFSSFKPPRRNNKLNKLYELRRNISQSKPDSAIMYRPSSNGVILQPDSSQSLSSQHDSPNNAGINHKDPVRKIKEKFKTGVGYHSYFPFTNT